MEHIEGNHKHFAALDGKIIIGYYIDTIHDMESITTPYVEITEELWLALTEHSIRNEFINSSDIVYSKIYTINDFNLFQEVASVDVDVPPTQVELDIKNLQVDLQETQTNLGNLQVSLDGLLEDVEAYSGQINAHNTDESAHVYIRALIDDVSASIPYALADLSADSTHQTVTDAEKATWNAKSNFSGNYDDLTNKPTIPSISGLATEGYVNDKDEATLQSAKSYADGIKNDLLNGAGEAYDTLKELGAAIDANKGAIDVLEDVAIGKADKEHTHDDRYYTEAEINSMLDAKANSNHDHESVYDTAGSAAKALSDAKVYTDSSVAQKTQVQIITWGVDD